MRKWSPTSSFFCQFIAHIHQKLNLLMQLLGKINYVLQVHPDDRDMLEARKWLQHSTK